MCYLERSLWEVYPNLALFDCSKEAGLSHLQRSVVQAELSDDEMLIWAGRPRQGFYFRSDDALYFPLGIMWGAFVFSWEFYATYEVLTGRWKPVAMIFAIIGTIILLVSMRLGYRRFWGDSRRRARIFYGVTDRRAIVVVEQKVRTVKSLFLGQAVNPTLTEFRNGWGTICWRNGTQSAVTFEMIENAKDVYDKILEAKCRC